MPATFKFLIVDDNLIILKLLRQSLEKSGELITATGGEDALRKAAGVQPDLIISDYSMLQMNGQELFEKLQGQSDTSGIPIVLLASQREIEQRIKAADGVEDHLV